MVQINWTPLKRFFKQVEILSTQPFLEKPVPEVGDKNIREILQGSYRIIYRLVSEFKIDVLTVHHSRRLLSNNPLFE